MSCCCSVWLPRICVRSIVAVFAGICAVRWWQREQVLVDSHIRWILGSLIVLAPTVHFWYLAWLLPFVCLRPALPWLCLSLSASVYFCVWSNGSMTTRWLFWAPFLLTLLYEVWSAAGRVVWPRIRPAGEAGTIAVVIPTRNAAEDLPGALASIARQTAAPDEVIVVDADSADVTRDLAERSPLVTQVLTAPPPGNQIAAGIAAAKSDWVLVLHADARLGRESIASVRAVAADRTVLGGSLGQRFSGVVPGSCS